MATTDLILDEPGTLQKPGWVGRLVRLVFGLFCISFVMQLFAVVGNVFDGKHINSVVWLGMAMGLYLSSYIINIGYSRSWKKLPAIVSASIFIAIGAFSYVRTGAVESALLGDVIGLWAIYLFAHLGSAFLLSGLIGTPGCEMRAFHDLFTRISGIPTKEHYCPVGPLHPLDRWEAKQSWHKDRNTMGKNG